ncbi:MAG: helix-turn-helix domain-containing protein [Phycisphaeraceae bacterium]|nr:helix-turn-helix domain-containing protein [Phycisphaeraceae bacterium]
MSLRAEISTQPAFVLLTAGDVACQLSCSPRHVRRMSERGAMPAPVKVGRLVRWDRDAIERWVASGCPALARHCD